MFELMLRLDVRERLLECRVRDCTVAGSSGGTGCVRGLPAEVALLVRVRSLAWDCCALADAERSK